VNASRPDESLHQACINASLPDALMQALGIIDCLAEPHLLPVLVKVKKYFGKTS